MAASSQAEAAARPGPALRLPLAWRLAGRELRGGIGGFRLFLFCLALGAAWLGAFPGFLIAVGFILIAGIALKH